MIKRLLLVVLICTGLSGLCWAEVALVVQKRSFLTIYVNGRDPVTKDIDGMSDRERNLWLLDNIPDAKNGFEEFRAFLPGVVDAFVAIPDGTTNSLGIIWRCERRKETYIIIRTLGMAVLAEEVK